MVRLMVIAAVVLLLVGAAGGVLADGLSPIAVLRVLLILVAGVIVLAYALVGEDTLRREDCQRTDEMRPS